MEWKMKRVLVFLLCLYCLSSCSSTRPDDELPVVNVSYFKPLPMRGLAPVFEVGLHIINPSATALVLNGLSYTITLEGQRVLVGVARDLPAIGAYSEGDAVVRASTDMVGSFLFITRLMQEKQGNIHYEFSASLDAAGLERNIKVVKSGEISFSGKQGRPD
jgi:hypothetical protein